MNMKSQKKLLYSLAKPGILHLMMLFLLTGANSSAISGPKNFLWEVSSGKGKVYLLGSVHVARESTYPLDPAINKAFESSSVLAVEMDPTAVDPIKYAQKLMLSDTLTLKGILSTPTYAYLKGIFDKQGMPEIAWSKLKPWAAAMTAMQIALQTDGFDPSLGIDIHFINKAKGKKKIVEVESMEFQTRLFDELGENADSLVSFLVKDLEMGSGMLDTLLLAWKNGDDQALEKYFFDEINDSPQNLEINKKLIDDRNINMMKKVESYLSSGETHFVIVGAGHLVGDSGIIKLLAKNPNFKIKRL